MRKRSQLYTILFVCVFVLLCKGQKKDEGSRFQPGVGLGYNWQNINTLDTYLDLRYYLSNYVDLRLSAGAGYFVRNAIYVAPTSIFSLNIGTPLRWADQNLGFTLATAAWAFKTRDHFENWVSPEVGLTSRGAITLSYGYNICLSNLQSSFVARNRITLRIYID